MPASTDLPTYEFEAGDTVIINIAYRLRPATSLETADPPVDPASPGTCFIQVYLPDGTPSKSYSLTLASPEHTAVGRWRVLYPTTKDIDAFPNGVYKLEVTIGDGSETPLNVNYFTLRAHSRGVPE